jgi:putative FmdB family regulatory protein
MPLYDYRCHKCGETFEVRQKFSDEPLQTHEGCGGEVERLISVPALQFKGTGWYITDYARGGGSSSGNGSSTSSASTSGKANTETKSDSKPAAKTETPKTGSDK